MTEEKQKALSRSIEMIMSVCGVTVPDDLRDCKIELEVDDSQEKLTDVG